MKYVLVLVCAVGCGSNPLPEEDASLDATTNDTNTTDQSAPKDASKDGAMNAGMDSAPENAGSDADADMDAGVDAAVEAGQCLSANDCKLFSSYCSTDPCVCFPLHQNDPNPKCNGQMVTCFVDPCLNKMPACDAGKCVVSP